MVVLFLGITLSFGLAKFNIVIGQVLQTYTSAGSSSWVCPAGVTHVMVQVWGAGGGGGNSANTTSNGGCGGGGGAYSESIIAVTAGGTYYYSVGAGGAGGPASSTTAAVNGGDSWFNAVNSAPTSTVGVLAKGEGHGDNNGNSAGGAGGSATSGFGSSKWSGGKGGSGSGGGGGGGGGSAGRYGVGGNGDGSAGGPGGIAGVYGGVVGGAGSSSTYGASGSAPGSGGGGSNDATGAYGGAGGTGKIVISRNLIMPYSGTTTLTDVGGTSTIYDPAYNETYYNNELQTLVLIPVSGSILTLTFTSFNTESTYDFLYVYNGNSTSATQVSGSPVSGSSLPAAITSTAADGSLTLLFDSDAALVDAGFVATLTASILPPTVTTATASSIGNFTASSGGNVTNAGGASVTAKGVLWGTSPGLTMPSASSTSNGTGTGSFTSSITGLSASTVYYYRAYALNSGGYGYGIEYSFVTTGPSAEGYYISGNIVNNGEIVSTYDENYLRMTGTTKTITGSGKFTTSKLFADGSTTFDDNLNAASAFTETFVNAGKSLTIATGRTFKNGTMGNYGTLTIAGTGIINNTANWVNGPTGTVTFGGAGMIYAAANWTNDGTFTAATGTVEFNGSTSGNTINGTTAFYNATINKGSSTATILDVNGTVTQTNVLTFTNGLLRIPTGGSWTKTGNGPTIGATSGLHVNGGTFTQNGASITNNGLFKTTTGTATIGNSSGNSITNQSGSSFIIDGGGTVNIAGRMEATGSGSFNQSAGTLNVCTSGNGSSTLGSIDMASESSFTMSGGAINIVKENDNLTTQIDYKNLAGTVSISGGTLTIGTTATSASSNFNIQGAMPPLVIDNTTNAKTATINGASTVYGNVTINSTSSLVLNSGVTATLNGSLSNSGTFSSTGTLNLAGDWTNNGTFTSNTGNTVAFNGGSASTISGSGTDNFQNLTITKTNSTPLLEVTLGKDATVLGTLTLTNGKLIVNGTKTLSIGNTSANGTISGGSSSSYIVAYNNGSTTGTLKHFVNVAASTVYNLPIGDATSYTPMTFRLDEAALSNAYITVYTKPSKIATMNASVTNYLNRYWDLTPSGITGALYRVTYTYVTGDIVGVEDNFFPVKRSLISTSPDVYAWYKPPETTFSSGTEQGVGGVDADANILTWRQLSTFSQFSAAGDQIVNLPIDLLSFDAKKQNQNNLLFWSTATETNSDYFTIEKTIDGASYEVVGQVNGGGTSFDQLDYSLVDYDVRKAINYYRLKQTDTDGAEKISALVSVDNRDNLGKEVAMKTNLLGQEINENYRGVVIVIFEDGTSIKIIQ